MCLYTKERKPRIAKEDITVLKYVICRDNEIISPYQLSKISVNEVTVAYPEREDIKLDGVDILHEDFYILGEGAIHAMLIEGANLPPYNFTRKKAIIPAETEYWVSTKGDEIAARSMIITDIGWEKSGGVSKNIFKDILETAPIVNGVRVGDYLLENGSYTKPREGLLKDDIIGIVAGFHEEKPLIASLKSFYGSYGTYLHLGPEHNHYLILREKAIKKFNGRYMTQEYRKVYYKSKKSSAFEVCIDCRKDTGEEWYLPALGEVITMLNNGIYLNAAHQITGFGPVLLDDGPIISSSSECNYSLHWCGYFHRDGIKCSLENTELGYKFIPFLGHRNNEPKCQDCECETELNTTVNT